MKITLINPPSPYLKNDASYPPSGLLYLAGKIEQLGHTAEVIDMSGNHQLKIPNDADIIGLTCVTPNVPKVKEIISKLPQVPILVGGPHPTFIPQEIYWGNEIPVRGEADSIISRVIADYQNKKLLRMYEGELPSINEVVHPARHLVDMNRYSPGGWEKSTVIYTSRGCPYSCRFCSKIQGSTFRKFDQVWVEKEIEDCISLGFRRLVFGDDNIIADKHRMKELLLAFKHHDIEYRLNQDARSLDKSIALLAAQTGCVEISFGIESGSQHILNMMHKQTTVLQNEHTLATARAAVIKTKAYLIVNFPGETPNTIKETLEFIERTKPDNVLVSSFVPLPGSHVFNNPDMYDIDWMSKDWNDYYLVGKDGHPKPTFTTKDLTVEQQDRNKQQLMDGLKCGY